MAASPSHNNAFTFTVGKLDAGMAILLGERAHLIEFPSLLLPEGATAGSIVNISVHRNFEEERKRDTEFWQLQDEVYKTFGTESPSAPELKILNVTQTSIVLEWQSLKLAQARLRSLDLYKDGQRIGALSNAPATLWSKQSGLQIGKEYSFQLVMRTTAGVYASNVVRARTHTMEETSGIRVCFGTVQDDTLLVNGKTALEDMGAQWTDFIDVDTTHFVCTTPADDVGGGPPGVGYQSALQKNIPVVQPQWILACHANRKMVPIANFYLGADPIPAQPFVNTRSQSISQASPTPHSQRAAQAGYRQSMPAPARGAPAPYDIGPVAKQTTHEEHEEDAEDEVEDLQATSPRRSQSDANGGGHKRVGTMKKNFQFPSTAGTPPPVPPISSNGRPVGLLPTTETVPTSPQSASVPPPPPVEKERSPPPDGDDDVGEIVDVPL